MHDQDLLSIFRAGLAAVDPYDAVRAHTLLSGGVLSIDGRSYDLADFDRVLVVGAGKATARMARALEDILGSSLTEGLVIVKYDHRDDLKTIRQVEASHPLPDQAGVDGTRAIIDLVSAANERTLVVCLLSGGGSALLVAPAGGISLADKQATTDALLRAGTDINELNAVRKHLSRVKGGRLARAAAPAAVATLILSDVIGDKLDVIASGPTVPDSTTFGDALAVVEKYGLRGGLPPPVLKVLDSGAAGASPDTPKTGDPCFARTQAAIVGSNRLALAAAQRKAGDLGYRATIVTDELRGEARTAARTLVRHAREARAAARHDAPICLLFGGETTVTVTGEGTGGRNQELALAFALEAEGLAGVSLLSCGTDGTDGPTDAAGAIVDATTASRARTFGVDPARYLAYNDSYHFFRQFDALSGSECHVKTGPTGTNVMDIQVLLVEP